MTLLRRFVLPALTVALLAPTGAGRAADEPPASVPPVSTAAGQDAAAPSGPVGSDATTAPAQARPLIWLRGPFGRVLGGTPGEPATAPPDGRALDAFVRGMPMLLEAEPPEALSRVQVTARQLGGSAHVDPLPAFGSAFEGPTRPGRQLIVVSTRDVGGVSGEHAWLVDVPDREPPDDGVYDIPAPAIAVSSGAGRVTAQPGQGCYVYLCVEIGQPAPAESLPALAARVDETLGLEIDDGSGMVAWKGTLRPLPEGAGPILEASGAATDAPVAAASLVGLEAPSAGTWLLEVTVTFDRQRGFLRTASRVVVE